MTSTIIFRTDPKLKAEAQRIAKEMGLTLTAIINNFLKDFVKRKSINFDIPSNKTIWKIPSKNKKVRF